MTLACQFVTYQVPTQGQILSVRVVGNNVMVRVKGACPCGGSRSEIDQMPPFSGIERSNNL